MSARNKLENKRARREIRKDHSVRMEKKRALQTRMVELMLDPPEEPRVSDLVIAETVLWTPDQDKK